MQGPTVILTTTPTGSCDRQKPLPFPCQQVGPKFFTWFTIQKNTSRICLGATGVTVVRSNREKEDNIRSRLIHFLSGLNFRQILFEASKNATEFSSTGNKMDLTCQNICIANQCLDNVGYFYAVNHFKILISCKSGTRNLAKHELKIP